MVTTIPARPPQGTHVHPKPLRSVPGIGHSHVRLRTLPPAPDAMEATASREAGGWGFGVTVVPWVVAGEPGPRTCQSLGGRLSGARALWLLRVMGTWEVYTRTPDHQRPYRKWPGASPGPPPQK